MSVYYNGTALEYGEGLRAVPIKRCRWESHRNDRGEARIRLGRRAGRRRAAWCRPRAAGPQLPRRVANPLRPSTAVKAPKWESSPTSGCC